jgi:hypothetical protein
MDKLLEIIRKRPMLTSLAINILIIAAGIKWLDPLVGTLPCIIILIALTAAVFIIVTGWVDDD